MSGPNIISRAKELVGGVSNNTTTFNMQRLVREVSTGIQQLPAKVQELLITKYVPDGDLSFCNIPMFTLLSMTEEQITVYFKLYIWLMSLQFNIDGERNVEKLSKEDILEHISLVKRVAKLDEDDPMFDNSNLTASELVEIISILPEPVKILPINRYVTDDVRVFCNLSITAMLAMTENEAIAYYRLTKWFMTIQFDL